LGLLEWQQCGLSTVFNLIDWSANDTLLIVILCQQ